MSYSVIRGFTVPRKSPLGISSLGLGVLPKLTYPCYEKKKHRPDQQPDHLSAR